jgi:hypothetical protein
MSISYKQSKELNASPELTDELYNELKKYLRAERVQKKALENRNKKPLDSPDVLDAEDFFFEPFEQKRGRGDSGNLLLATHKTDAAKKYIVKHAYCDCAANEYVYCNIARALGLKMPDVKLFRLLNPLDDTLFETEYVVGIEYLNIVKKYPGRETLANVKNADDSYKFNTLYRLFYESDRLETVLADDGYVYRIDTSAAFLMHDTMLLTSDFNKLTGVAFRAAVKNLMDKWSWEYMDMGLKGLVESWGDDKVDTLLSPLYDIQEIEKPHIRKFLDTLCYFYPDSVGEYFNLFFMRLKLQASLFTNFIEKHRPAPYFKQTVY